MRIPLTLLLATLVAAPALASTGYYREPAIRGDTIVFTAEGDLWSVATSGGQARRLTTHPAEEAQAVLSPDGREVAFVAAYDGTPELYRMPLAGGEPERITFHGGRLFVQGWHADLGILYSSDAAVGPTHHRVLRAIAADGSVRQWPLAQVTDATPAGDGALWFTRFGLKISTDNAHAYRGGARARLWRWTGDEGAEATPVGDAWNANLTAPLAWNDRLVVTADIEGLANLWLLPASDGAPEALTRHADFEVRGAAIDGGRIVYQHGADLRLFDLSDRSDRKLEITLASDFEQRRERHLKKPLAFLNELALAADGSRVAVTARGRAALAGTGPLRRVEITAPATARLRSAVPSVDGRWLYAIVDEGAGSEVWRLPADGSTGGEALTKGGDAHRWRLAPDPTGRWLAHDDKRGRLWLTDLEKGGTKLLDQSPVAADRVYGSIAWSADGKLLALARADSRRLLNQIVLVDIASGRKATLSSDRYESFDPAFSRDGRWLYFLSNRSFQGVPGGPWGDRNTGPFYDRRTKVYAVALAAGQRFPFLPADELAPKPVDDAKAEGEVRIEWEGLADRLFEVPLAAGNYSELALDGERLYLLDRPSAPGAKAELKTYPIGNQGAPAETFMGDLADFQLSADGKKLLLIKAGSDPTAPQLPGEILLVDAGAKAPADISRAQVRLADWALAIDPEQEWQQMFDDAWRMHRAFSFDPALRGVDWDAQRARFQPMVARIADRAELDDLLGQMIAPLSILHSQVRGGELRADPEAVAPAFLGATLRSSDEGVVIERVYASDPELPSERAPLAQPGVDARAGDRIVAINGRRVARESEVAAALRAQAGQQVLVELARGGKTHRTVVVPVAAEQDASLRYGDWVQSTRERVQAAAGGRIGYLHLRAMGAGDMASFVREFYAQFDREGLIIDVRRNRGGNIDAWVIEKLLKRAWAFWKPVGGTPYWNQQQSFRGHLVVLADELTYSDGETFAAGIKALGLGPVIGMRTAGAGIWLSDRNRLADGGTARIAEFGQFDRQGRWMIEGWGVEPDIQVENLPLATGKGGDAQLEAALGHLLDRLQKEPVVQPEAETIPPAGTPGRG